MRQNRFIFTKVVILFFVGLFGLVGDAFANPVMTGDISSYLGNMLFGIANDNRWVNPTIANQAEVQDIVSHILIGEYDEAHEKASALEGEVISFTDGAREYTILHLGLERRANDKYYSTGGVYVFNSAGKNSAIHIAHPIADINTNLEGVEAFLALDSKYLLISGTHRNSSDALSVCQSSFYESDPSHNNSHYFFNVQQTLFEANENIIFIDFHGFGSSSRTNIWNQCDVEHNNSIVNLSEGSDELDVESFMYLLHQEITNNTTIKSCIYSPTLNNDVNDVYTSILGGTTNVGGRFLNNSADVCNTPATAPSHKFIHVEQSYEVRVSRRSEIIESLGNALDNYFMNNLVFRADVDQNATINSTDAMLTLRNSLGLDMSGTNWVVSATTGDVNCNGSSNSTDAMLLLRYSLGLSMGGTGWCVD